MSPSQPAGSLRVASLQARGARQYLPGGSVPVARPTRGPQERARRNAGRAIAGAVLGIEFLAVGSLAILAGDGLDVPPGSDADAYLGSRILDWAGLGTALAGLLVWCLLGWWRRGPAGAPEAVTDQPVPG